MNKKIMLATALSALVVMPAMSEDFVIGAVNAKTGFMASYDAPFMQGVSMYQTEANARGGFLGKYPIELIERDDASDVQKSTVSTAEVMATEKMHAFITWH